MAFSWIVSGVDSSRWRLRSTGVWRPPVIARENVVSIPRVHGDIQTEALPVFEAGTINVVFQPIHDSQDELEAAFNELLSVVGAPGVELVRVSGGLETSARVRLVSVAPQRLATGVLAEVDVLFSVPSVFFRGLVVSAPVAGVSNNSVVRVDHLGVGSAPVSDAVLRFRGPLTSVSVVDEHTGTGVSWTPSGAGLTADQYLYLDVGNLTARRSTSASAWASGGTDVTGGLDYPPAGLLQLWPKVVDPRFPDQREVAVKVTGSGFGSDSSLVVRGAPAYF